MESDARMSIVMWSYFVDIDKDEIRLRLVHCVVLILCFGLPRNEIISKSKKTQKKMFNHNYEKLFLPSEF